MHLPPLLLCLLAAHALAREPTPAHAPANREIPTLQYLKPKSNRARLIDQRAVFYGEGDRLNPGARRGSVGAAGARRGRNRPKQTIEEVSISLADLDAEDQGQGQAVVEVTPAIGIAHGHEDDHGALEALGRADAQQQAEEDAMLMAHREVDDTLEHLAARSSPDDMETERAERALRKREKEHERMLMSRDGQLGLAEEMASYTRAKKGVRQRRRKQGKGKARMGKGGGGAATAHDRAKAKAMAKLNGGKGQEAGKAAHVAEADTTTVDTIVHDASSETVLLDSSTVAAAAAAAAVDVEPVLAAGQYASCQTHRHAIGYARFPGWRLEGDEMSGAVPMMPEMACVSACTHYGEGESSASEHSAALWVGLELTSLSLYRRRVLPWVEIMSHERHQHLRLEVPPQCRGRCGGLGRRLRCVGRIW